MREYLARLIKFIRPIVAYWLAGLLVPELWQYIANPFGYGAGFIAGLIIIGPVWYVNHYRGFIPQSEEAATVDMGLAIGTAVLVRDALENGRASVLTSMPTLLSLLVGAVLAGALVSYLRRSR